VKRTTEGKGNWNIEGGFIVLYWSNGVKSRLSLAQAGYTRTGDTMLSGISSWMPNIRGSLI